jgi:hypothetical protein
VRVTVGDAFRLRMGDAQHIRIEGACDRLDRSAPACRRARSTLRATSASGRDA